MVGNTPQQTLPPPQQPQQLPSGAFPPQPQQLPFQQPQQHPVSNPPSSTPGDDAALSLLKRIHDKIGPVGMFGDTPQPNKDLLMSMFELGRNSKKRRVATSDSDE